MLKTKMVVTIDNEINNKTLKGLIENDINVFRFNLCNIELDLVDKLIDQIREISKKLKKFVGIMLDIPGPTIRIDNLKEKQIYLELDRELRFYNYHVICNNTQISTNYENLTELVHIGDIINIGYGDVKLEVIEINNDNFLVKVIDSGYIKSNQIIHLNSNYDIPFISPNDKESILYAINKDIDFLALSYVRDEGDVLSVVDMLIENENDHIEILAKIENEDAFLNLESILKVSDGVIVERGNLGINTEFEKVPFYQKEILKMANNHQKISLVATNYDKGIDVSKNPVRVQMELVTDMYNLVLDKTDGIILESQITCENSIEVTKTFKKILLEAENSFDYKANLDLSFKQSHLDVTSTIAYSVVDSSLILNANGIIANTMSGYTARKISNFRPRCDILGFSPSEKTLYSLTLSYGIIPVLVKKYHETDQIVTECLNKYKEIMNYKVGDTVIITGGMPLNNANTDFMKIEKITEEE